MRSSLGLSCAFLIALTLSAAEPALALVTVGPDTGKDGCSYRTIHEAVKAVHDAEQVHPGDVDPFIAVAGGNTYVDTLVFDGSNISNYTDPYTGAQNAFIQIYGDYDDTCHFENGSAASIIAGSDGDSVLEVTGDSHVILNQLVMSGATNVSRGGGISFHDGSGTLELSNVAIHDNNAAAVPGQDGTGVGGGIYANGSATGLTIILHAGTIVAHNTANSGGGIALKGNTHLYAVEDQILIYGNQAILNGGGFDVDGPEAVLDIGSSGYATIPVIDSNSANLGGGIAVLGGGTARVFSIHPNVQTGIADNSATIYGGGVYVAGKALGTGKFCAFGYGIDHNSAMDGAAIYADSGDGFNPGGLVGLERSRFQPDMNGKICGTAAALPGAANLACNSPGHACNSISRNFGGGSTINLQSHSSLRAEQVEFRANQALRVLEVTDTWSYSELSNCLIAGNTVAQDLIRTEPTNILDNGLFLVACTVAGNNLPVQMPVFSFLESSTTVQQSIIWQPNNPTFSSSTIQAGLDLEDLIAHDADTFSGAFAAFSNVHNYNPYFFDPATGDFHLRAESPAVDYAASLRLAASPNVDIEGASRPDIEFPHFPTNTGYDIGAYELHGGFADLIFFDGYDIVH